MDALGWKYYIVYDCFLAFEVVYIWFFCVETLGRNGPLPLEEIAQLFDGEDSVNDMVNATHAQIQPRLAEQEDLKEKTDHVEKVDTLGL